MGIPFGLIKATNYYNRIEAWKDWNGLTERVCEAGYFDLIEKYRPDKDVGWRKIDKATEALRYSVDLRRMSATGKE